jgi:hypothetical protein
MFSKIMVHPEAHKKFGIRDRLIWTKGQLQCESAVVDRNKRAVGMDL